MPIVWGTSQDVHFFFACSHLSEPHNCWSIINNFSAKEHFPVFTGELSDRWDYPSKILTILTNERTQLLSWAFDVCDTFAQCRYSPPVVPTFLQLHVWSTLSHILIGILLRVPCC